MPTIDPALIPSITPGNLFTRFTEDTTLNIRWLTATDPVLFEALNRPMADITVRQLILAKALDALNLRISHQALFPFLITPKVAIGSTSQLELPVSWIWDMHVSVPAKWELLRLAKIKRISGVNGTTITGSLRLIFTGQERGSATEVALFYVDYQIDSVFTYQIKRIVPATTAEEPVAIDSGEANTVDGFITFRTLDQTDSTISSFLEALEPPSPATDSNSDGVFDSPSVYEMVSTGPGGITEPDDFIESALDHGTGILVNSAFNSIPDQDSDINSWLVATNFPFRIGATRTSLNGVTIPTALFREMDIIIPAPDEATGDVSRQNFPVWLAHIERVDDLATTLKFTFSTHSIKPSGIPVDVAFATLTLQRTMTPGQVVNIVPIDDLLEQSGADQANFRQGFGHGHVVLSSLWGATTEEVENFFDSFLSILDVPPRATFVQSSAIISHLALSRNSVYTPTKGQWEALRGTSARLSTPANPSDTNRFVTEGDQGIGEKIDFRTKPGFPDDLRENADIEPEAWMGSLAHRMVILIVDASGNGHDYDKDILPRLQCLLGRDPIFGDFWYDGTLLKFFNGDTWISL
jgi:hypothetical protein